MAGLGGLLMAVTMATVGRGVAMEAGMVEVAAFSTRGRVFVVRTGVTVSVFYSARKRNSRNNRGVVSRDRQGENRVQIR